MPVADMGKQIVLTDPYGVDLEIWQPGTSAGFTVLGETGTPGWFELITPKYQESLKFYKDVFKWETKVMSDIDDFKYTNQIDPDTQAKLAGIMDGIDFLGT